MKASIIIASVVFFLMSCQPQETSRWQLAYKNDSEGNVIQGSKKVLLEAVRKGIPVRIGFGGRSKIDSLRSTEHYADASFLTVLDDQEVFAQISQIVGQQPIRDGRSKKLRFRDGNKWTKIVGTNGYSSGLMIDVFNDTVVNPSMDRKATTTWFVFSN